MEEVPAWFQAFNVSRETLDRLQIHVDLLQKWQKSLNLVSPQTLPHLWHRHVMDSAQLMPLISTIVTSLLDVGSGAGFPGITLAILTNLPTVLVESDHKKAAFLREVTRLTGAPVTVLSERIESLPLVQADLMTARALAPLSQLLTFQKSLAPQALGLYLKGERAEEEIVEALKVHDFSYEKFPSKTDCSGVILRVKLKL